MNYTNYFLFFFLSVSFLSIFGAMTYSMINEYNVELSDDFGNYIDSFNGSAWANEDVLTVEPEGNEAGGEFAAYSSSFRFSDQVKTTFEQTGTFIQSTGNILGLPPIFFWVITGAITIILLVLAIFFARGVNESR